MSINPKKTEMPVQDPNVRKHNFNEVALGYSEEDALNEANRCLHCANMPCVSGCPVNVKIPDFISKIKEHKFKEAYDIISESSSLPAVCGRVCPQENQCESKCTMGIKFEPVGIGRLERFVADYHISLNTNSSEKISKSSSNVSSNNKHKVAVIGSGPSSLSCAGDLIKLGYSVTVFEALHVPGGVLVYGIPEFRLPKRIVEKEIKELKNLGVEFKTNVVIGKTFSLEDLFKIGYDAIFIGSGAGLPTFMNIQGEQLKGVYSANEYLTRSNLMKSFKTDSNTPIMRGKNVAVVGGGNVAMDSVRTALRLGAENVYCIYRRSEVELPARKEEVEHAKEEGVIFYFLTNPVEILSYTDLDPKDEKNGFVKSIRCIKMQLGEPDERGRRTPISIPNSEFEINVDTVIMALGTKPNPLIRNTSSNISYNKHGGIIIDENGMTSCEGVFAGGDAVTGSATVISAMGSGKVAARSIDLYIKTHKV